MLDVVTASPVFNMASQFAAAAPKAAGGGTVKTVVVSAAVLGALVALVVAYLVRGDHAVIAGILVVVAFAIIFATPWGHKFFYSAAYGFDGMMTGFSKGWKAG